MIDAQLMPDEGILIMSPVDKLETTDFERLRLLADPYIEEHGGLNGLLIDAESFPGWADFSSMLSHIRFVNHYEKKSSVSLLSPITVFLQYCPRSPTSSSRPKSGTSTTRTAIRR